ncbi:hypothetical protein Aduo_012351 [Ancylostoma duodenale]
MTEFVTPVSSHPIQDRPSKRSRVSPTCTNDQSFDHAIKMLINDDQIPAHLKTIVGHLVDKLSGMELLIKRNTELENRLEEGEAEKKRLKEENESLRRALFNKSVGIPSQRGNDLLRRAPRLKSFPVSGIFIRPSLPKEERERLRALRLARNHSARDDVNSQHQTVSSRSNQITPSVDQGVAANSTASPNPPAMSVNI